MSDTLSDNIINAVKTFDWLRVLRMIRNVWDYCFEACQLNWYSGKFEKEVLKRWFLPLDELKKEPICIEFSTMIGKCITEEHNLYKPESFFSASLEDFSKYLIGEDIPIEKIISARMYSFIILAVVIFIPLLCITLSCFYNPKISSLNKRHFLTKLIAFLTPFYICAILPFKNSDALKAIRAYATQFLSLFFSFKYIVGIDELIFVLFAILVISAFYICKRASRKSEVCRKIAASMLFLRDSFFDLVNTVYIAVLINQGILSAVENDVISLVCIVLSIVIMFILFKIERNRKNVHQDFLKVYVCFVDASGISTCY